MTTVPFLVYLAVVGTLESSLWLAASAFAVIAYSAKGLRFKEIPFLDSVTSAFHFVSPAIVGWTIFGVGLAGRVAVFDLHDAAKAAAASDKPGRSGKILLRAG